MSNRVATIAGDPNEVADAALAIAQTPFGKRQLRYRIGSGGPGVVEINKLTDEVQQQILQAFGLTELTKQASGSPASV